MTISAQNSGRLFTAFKSLSARIDAAIERRDQQAFMIACQQREHLLRQAIEDLPDFELWERISPFFTAGTRAGDLPASWW